MLDLIPADYRAALLLRRRLAWFAWACAAILALGAAGRGALAYVAAGEREAVARLKQADTRTAAQRARLTELRLARTNARQRAGDVDRLREGFATQPLFLALDAALNDRVWLNELTFSSEPPAAKSAAPTALAAPAANPPVLQPAGSPAAGPAAPVAGERQVTLRGQALDHASLGDFVQRLLAQPGIAQVRVVDTASRSYLEAQVLDFHLVAKFDAPREAVR